MAVIGGGLLSTFATIIWTGFEKTHEAIGQLTSKVKELEDERSKWGLLTELHNHMIALDKKATINEVNHEWVKWTIGVGRIEVPVSVIPAPEPKPEPGPKPVPVVPPDPPPQKTEPPKKLPFDQQKKPLDPDDLRRLYEQKYPNEFFKKGEK
jgi:hypothetical protein